MTSPEPEGLEPPSRKEGTDPTRRARTVAAILGASLLAALVVYAVVTLGSDDGCEDWQQQFDGVSEGLALYVRAKGDGRIVALAALESVELRCAKVAEVRDVCTAVYRSLADAEVEHERAKRALADLERAIGSLDEPTRSVASSRFIDSDALFVIAERLDMPIAEVRRHIESAREAIGGERLEELHGRFERSVTTSQKNVDAAREGNLRCDAAYKRLLEEEQSR